MLLPFPTDPSSLAGSNPLFNDNAFARGDQMRSLTSEAWTNFGVLATLLTNFYKGYIKGKMYVRNASEKVLRVPVGNFYEVNGKYLFTTIEQSLNFGLLTNIFRTDGVTQITNVSETANVQLYILLTETGIMQAMIIPLPSEIGSYTNTVKLYDAYFSGTPSGVWDSTKNGYYKNGKRIIGIVKLNASNNIEAMYELGNGFSFQDTEGMGAGSLFFENRYKRRHPACYLCNGVSIANMETESPHLFAILNSVNPPNYVDRFMRSISLSSPRSLRDLEEDSVIEHYHRGIIFGQVGVTISGLSGVGDGLSSGVRDSGDISIGGTETRPKNFSSIIQIVRG